MRIAAQRRQRDGQPEPGVVYIDITTFGHEARQCAARLSHGDQIRLSDRLEPEDGHHVLIDQLDYL